MRPVSNFLIMQLSNSRFSFSGCPNFSCVSCAPVSPAAEVLSSFGTFGIIPSLTVEKKNECHNP